MLEGVDAIVKGVRGQVVEIDARLQIFGFQDGFSLRV